MGCAISADEAASKPRAKPVTVAASPDNASPVSATGKVSQSAKYKRVRHDGDLYSGGAAESTNEESMTAVEEVTADAGGARMVSGEEPNAAPAPLDPAALQAPISQSYFNQQEENRSGGGENLTEKFKLVHTWADSSAWSTFDNGRRGETVDDEENKLLRSPHPYAFGSGFPYQGPSAIVPRSDRVLRDRGIKFSMLSNEAKAIACLLSHFVQGSPSKLPDSPSAPQPNSEEGAEVRHSNHEQEVARSMKSSTGGVEAGGDEPQEEEKVEALKDELRSLQTPPPDPLRSSGPYNRRRSSSTTSINSPQRSGAKDDASGGVDLNPGTLVAEESPDGIRYRFKKAPNLHDRLEVAKRRALGFSDDATIDETGGDTERESVGGWSFVETQLARRLHQKLVVLLQWEDHGNSPNVDAEEGKLLALLLRKPGRLKNRKSMNLRKNVSLSLGYLPPLYALKTPNLDSNPFAASVFANSMSPASPALSKSAAAHNVQQQQNLFLLTWSKALLHAVGVEQMDVITALFDALRVVLENNPEVLTQHLHRAEVEGVTKKGQNFRTKLWGGLPAKSILKKNQDDPSPEEDHASTIMKRTSVVPPAALTGAGKTQRAKSVLAWSISVPHTTTGPDPLTIDSPSVGGWDKRKESAAASTLLSPAFTPKALPAFTPTQGAGGLLSPSFDQPSSPAVSHSVAGGASRRCSVFLGTSASAAGSGGGDNTSDSELLSIVSPTSEVLDNNAKVLATMVWDIEAAFQYCAKYGYLKTMQLVLDRIGLLDPAKDEDEASGKKRSSGSQEALTIGRVTAVTRKSIAVKSVNPASPPKSVLKTGKKKEHVEGEDEMDRQTTTASTSDVAATSDLPVQLKSKAQESRRQVQAALLANAQSEEDVLSGGKVLDPLAATLPELSPQNVLPPQGLDEDGLVAKDSAPPPPLFVPDAPSNRGEETSALTLSTIAAAKRGSEAGISMLHASQNTPMILRSEPSTGTVPVISPSMEIGMLPSPKEEEKGTTTLKAEELNAVKDSGEGKLEKKKKQKREKKDKDKKEKKKKQKKDSQTVHESSTKPTPDEPASPAAVRSKEDLEGAYSSPKEEQSGEALVQQQQEQSPQTVQDDSNEVSLAVPAADVIIPNADGSTQDPVSNVSDVSSPVTRKKKKKDQKDLQTEEEEFVTDFVAEGLVTLKTRISKPSLLINALGPSAQTALIMAASRGHVDVFEYLLTEHNAKIFHQDKFGYSAVHWAAFIGCTAILEVVARYYRLNEKFLKIKGENSLWELVNLKTNEGRSALHYCAMNNHIDAGMFLTQSCSANVNMVEDLKFGEKAGFGNDNKGWTPLHHAVFSGHWEFVLRVLVDSKKLQPKLATQTGRTIIDLAKKADKVRARKLFTADDVFLEFHNQKL